MTIRIVLDASAAANIVMRTDSATRLIDKLENTALVMAPELFHSEIANTMWKYVRAGDLDTPAAIDRYEEAISLIDTFEADKRLITEALSSASKYNHPVYDMMYAVLARRYGCSILSMDKRLIVLLQKIDIDLA
ncbi:MAG: type II toxin-antitoxin system VapC family toxin [Pseudomonadota bacterium]